MDHPHWRNGGGNVCRKCITVGGNYCPKCGSRLTWYACIRDSIRCLFIRRVEYKEVKTIEKETETIVKRFEDLREMVDRKDWWRR